MHSDVDNIGHIEFSSSLLNNIQKAIHWGQRANIMSVPTDCPQRDERKGWLGDAQLSAEEALSNFDMVATLIKFLHDIVDTQVRLSIHLFFNVKIKTQYGLGPVCIYACQFYIPTQNEDGQIADTAPFTFGGRPADPSWGSAFPSLVYYLYKYDNTIHSFIRSLLHVSTDGIKTMFSNTGRRGTCRSSAIFTPI